LSTGNIPFLAQPENRKAIRIHFILHPLGRSSLLRSGSFA
jgi:hypothetical protein